MDKKKRLCKDIEFPEQAIEKAVKKQKRLEKEISVLSSTALEKLREKMNFRNLI